MIIGINARILNTKTIRGWSRYTHNLICGLSREGVELRLFSDEPLNLEWVPEELHKSIYVEPGLSYIHWEQYVLKKLAEKHKVDILHCPINYGLPYFGKFKKVLTLHDSIEKSFYRKQLSVHEKLRVNYFKMSAYFFASQRAADKLITVSESAKEDIVKEYGISDEKISVIYEAAEEDIFNRDHVKNEKEFTQRWRANSGYLLYIGGFEERKNIKFILDMARRLPQQQFVLVGGGDIEGFSPVPANVHFTGYVDEKWLPSFYHYAKAFIYPSFYEGFGLQLVESMALDKPCLYSNVTSLPEIYGSDEWGFDPYSVDQAIEKLRYLENNYSKAVDYVKNRKKFFSWDKSTKETIDLYRSIY